MTHSIMAVALTSVPPFILVSAIVGDMVAEDGTTITIRGGDMGMAITPGIISTPGAIPVGAGMVTHDTTPGDIIIGTEVTVMAVGITITDVRPTTQGQTITGTTTMTILEKPTGAPDRPARPKDHLVAP
jgi:hypothetical protein